MTSLYKYQNNGNFFHAKGISKFHQNLDYRECVKKINQALSQSSGETGDRHLTLYLWLPIFLLKTFKNIGQYLYIQWELCSLKAYSLAKMWHTQKLFDISNENRTWIGQFRLKIKARYIRHLLTGVRITIFPFPFTPKWYIANWLDERLRA